MTTTTSPWDRFGRWVAVPWLIFLVFPLFSTWVEPGSTGKRLAATAVVIAFGATYVFGFATGRVWVVALLVVLTGVYGVIDGLNSLGTLPFIVAFANIQLPIRWALPVAGATVIAAFVIPTISGQLDTYWPLAVIVTSVAIGTGIVAVIDSMAETHHMLDQQIIKTDERFRIARDVHDVLGHSLTVIALKADLTSRLLDTVEVHPESSGRLDQARTELAELQSATRSALADIRTTVGGLRITSLDAELAAAAEVLADAGIVVECAGQPEDVAVELRQLFAWAVREGTTNIIRHAQATTCVVELSKDRLRISDNGVGLREHAAGNGLQGLRERVELVGASLSIAPAAPGTTLEIVAGR